MSWKSLNMEFSEKYKPFTHKDDDEFWICLEDFRCNFGGLVICSSREAFRCQGFNIERKYAVNKQLHGRKTSNSLPTSGRNSNRSSRDSTDDAFSETAANNQCARVNRDPLKPKEQTCRSTRALSYDIYVKETQRTVKLDTCEFHSTDSSGGSAGSLCKNVYHKKSSFRKHLAGHKSRRKLSHQEPRAGKHKSSDPSKSHSLDDTETNGKDIHQDDTYSTSDIYITVQNSQAGENSTNRPRSAPVQSPIPRAQSTGSLTCLTESTFLATRADHFRSHGAWHEMVVYKGAWKRTVGSRLIVDSVTVGPRVLLAITKPDAVNENIAPDFEGRSHVLISLMQDYRRGSSIVGILMAHIGFFVYKTKNPDKDEKRSLSKLQMVARQDSKTDSREISMRLDLLPGNYFIVPYCSDFDHEGEFLLRVLGEKDSIAAKSGCLVS